MNNIEGLWSGSECPRVGGGTKKEKLGVQLRRFANTAAGTSAVAARLSPAGGQRVRVVLEATGAVRAGPGAAG